MALRLLRVLLVCFLLFSAYGASFSSRILALIVIVGLPRAGPPVPTIVEQSNGAPTGWTLQKIAVNSNNKVIVAVGDDASIVSSGDGGTTWVWILHPFFCVPVLYLEVSWV